VRVRILKTLDAIAADRWNALDLKGCPFVRHEFLALLEREHCAHAATGWTPQHLVVEDEAGELLGAMPLYLKPHSWGEFVFDWGWANAYTRAGVDYYPKLVSAIPFTPATGPRLLCALEGDVAGIRGTLIAAAMDLATQLGVSSLHVLFPEGPEQAALVSHGFIPRRDCQFHWHNRGFADFDAFLAGFRADKRKKANRERRRIAEAGIEFRTLGGAEIDADLWDVIHAFSLNTFRRHGHDHYLTAAFFRHLAQVLPEMIMVKLAVYHSRPVAAAIFFVGADTLYGRYWGAAADFDSLHFEACYYQGIEYCIERGLARFEPGTQGEHKVPRGFEPSPTCSAHWLADPRFATAIAAHLRQEGIAVDEYMAGIREHLPFRRAEGASAEPADGEPL
jgi:predicted N-acyltransferase